MRCLVIFCLISFNGLSQWKSTTFGSMGVIPSYPINQFIIDPYRNAFWFVNDLRATVIESDGSIHTFSENELGNVWTESYLTFAFTPIHIYYSRQLIGLYSFDDYTPQNVFTNQVIENMTSDQDTVFFYDAGGGTIFKHDGIVTSQLWFGPGQNFISKNGNRYGDSGGLIVYKNSVSGTIIQFVDADYLPSSANTFSFQRYTDTLYVAQETGITLIHEVDAFDTITQNNTVNMPSPNVLDIAFDMNDSLWAVFGDANGDAFALAKLEGNTWTNLYTSANSPIDFATYRELQFDTSNNIWVVDFYRLHTIENANSPSWLGLSESEYVDLSVFPNPSNGEFTIDVANAQDISELVIFNMLGQEVFRSPFTSTINLNVESGTYVLSLVRDGEIIGRKKIIVE
jgi:hypothetical protein